MSGLVLLAALVLAVLAAFAVVIALKGRQSDGGPEEAAFEARRDLFSPAERSFYGVLEQAVAEEFMVFGKVRLGDLVQPAKGLSQSRRTTLRNQIQQKHVDFVLCRPDTLAVAGVVELDDSSHGRKDRADRDDFVDKALASAGVPVLHFPARKAYAVGEVQAKLAESLALKVKEIELPMEQAAVKVAEETASQASVAQAQASASVVPAAVEATVAEPPASPVCPACSSAMVKRQAKNGQYAGKWFWACSGYPKCRKIVAVG